MSQCMSNNSSNLQNFYKASFFSYSTKNFLVCYTIYLPHFNNSPIAPHFKYKYFLSFGSFYRPGLTAVKGHGPGVSFSKIFLIFKSTFLNVSEPFLFRNAQIAPVVICIS
jgi:hypothetical protein